MKVDQKGVRVTLEGHHNGDRVDQVRLGKEGVAAGVVGKLQG